MALGFGFNKQKVLAAAEKFVQQGKLQNAITEYEKIVKEDPKDLTVLNTIGDLCARVGNNDKATVYFKRVGDNYATEGFTVKAIAVYKKIAKLAPNATENIVKLAELYTQQGLYNDARAQYVAVADQYLKSNEQEAAARMFQKILELDPENTGMQGKLADLYIKLGKREEARNIFLTAAQSLYLKGALDAADESLRRVIALDPGNADAMLLRGKIATDSGNAANAVTLLEKIPNLDSRPDALRALLTAHILARKFDAAAPLAAKLVNVHNDTSGASSLAEGLMAAEQYDKALAVYSQFADRLIAANSKGLMDTLHATINRIKENPRALEMLIALYQKAGDPTNINEVTELLAHAYVQANELPKAAALYKQLSELEPENALHAQNYKQIQSRLGQDAAQRPLTREEGGQALMIEEMEIEHAVPGIEQKYPDSIKEAVKAALTEAELFDSYNMPTKALAPLEGALAQAPRDAQLNQRLASIYARSGRMDEAAQRCEVLQSVYADAGYAQQASQYGQMASKYRERSAQRAASISYDASFMPGHELHAEHGAEPPPQTTSVPAFAEVSETPPPGGVSEFSMDAVAPAEAQVAEFTTDSGGTPAMSSVAAPVPAAAPPAAGAPVEAHEIDLTEWESMTVEEHGAPPTAAAPATPAAPAASDVGEALQEVRFYISQAMWLEARNTLTQVTAQAPGHPEIAELEQKIGAELAAQASAPVSVEPTVADFSFDVPPEPAVQAPQPPPPPAPKAAPPPPPPKPAPAPPQAAKPAPAPPATPPAPAAPPAPAKAAKKADALSDFVLDLEESLGEDFAPGGKPGAAPPPAAKPAPAKAAPPPPAPPVISKQAAGDVLADMFDEFKEGVEEQGTEAEDPDTHYNLGVAFKEMGLLDEAIGELQKVCKAIDKGHPFSQSMQAYTWLAHCFVEKGAPEASVKWYEKALTLPGADEDSKLAVHYELASAYEQAGNKKAALSNFMLVYSSNIDYRDVAERIKTLKA